MAVAALERRTHKERRADSDRRILQAAIELFAGKGYQRTTLVQIGELAGCTGTLISNRYGSKEGLLRAVLVHILNRLESSGDAAAPSRPSITPETDTPAPELLSTFVQAYFDDIVQSESRIRALYVIIGEALGSLPEIQDDVVKVNIVFRRAIEEIVSYGIARGDFPDHQSPQVTATLIVGLLRGVTQQILAEPDMDVRSLVEPTKASAGAIACNFG